MVAITSEVPCCVYSELSLESVKWETFDWFIYGILKYTVYRVISVILESEWCRYLSYEQELCMNYV